MNSLPFHPRYWEQDEKQENVSFTANISSFGLDQENNFWLPHKLISAPKLFMKKKKIGKNNAFKEKKVKKIG